MKAKLLHLLILLLIAGTSSVLISPASAQGNAEQSPYFLIKIPDIEDLLSDAMNLVPESQVSDAQQQVTQIRTMLFGTDWIDTERSIVMGVTPQGDKIQSIALVPFLTPNQNFQMSYGAVEGEDYYLLAFPLQPGFNVNPSLEYSLAKASRTPASGSLIIEAAAVRLIAMVEPLIAESLEKMESTQPADTPASPLAPQDIQAMIDELMAIGRQADILRYGLDLDTEELSVLMDVDAQPGTTLSGVLRDIGGEARLMEYPIDMPVKIHSRAYDMAGMHDLVRPYLDIVYGQMGLDINLDEITEMNKSFTGETAGGISISPNGLTMEYVAVLQSGIDGETFIRHSYLPYLERSIKSSSDLEVDQQGSTRTTMKYERTEDSRVAGARAMGSNLNFAISDPKNDRIIFTMDVEMRMAAVGDLFFIASSDTTLGEAIHKTRNLSPVPASGPVGRMSMDLTALFQGIRVLLPPESPLSSFPDDLGTISSQLYLQNGKLQTRTSFKVEDIKRLVSIVSALAAQTGNTGAADDHTHAPGAI